MSYHVQVLKNRGRFETTELMRLQRPHLEDNFIAYIEPMSLQLKRVQLLYLDVRIGESDGEE